MFIQEEIDSIKEMVPQFIKGVTVVKSDDYSAELKIITLENMAFDINLSSSGYMVLFFLFCFFNHFPQGHI